MDVNELSMVVAVMSFVFTFYYSIVYPKRKKCVAKFCWDGLRDSFCIVIYNTGQKCLILDSLELYYKKSGRKISIGKRENMFSDNNEAKSLMPGNSIVYIPTYGSIYDVLGYYGHFDVDLIENRDEIVHICVADIEGKKFWFRTNFTLGQIDDYICHKC